VKLYVKLPEPTELPKHFVNLTGESKNFKMLEFLLEVTVSCVI
jgi:hypothetical protein